MIIGSTTLNDIIIITTHYHNPIIPYSFLTTSSSSNLTAPPPLLLLLLYYHHHHYYPGFGLTGEPRSEASYLFSFNGLLGHRLVQQYETTTSGKHTQMVFCGHSMGSIASVSSGGGGSSNGRSDGGGGQRWGK